LLKHGEAYVRQGMDDYERKFHEGKLNRLKKTAAAMGFELTAKQPVTLLVFYEFAVGNPGRLRRPAVRSFFG